MLLQEIILDDLLERISLSKYRDNLILKGGFLIASLLGVNMRSTMDMDTTLVGLPMSEKEILSVFKTICATSPKEDIIALTPIKIEPIRKDDVYGGYRVHIKAQLFSIQPTIKVDISTGDIMTPREIHYKHQLISEDRTITVMAYNLETILAEKIETIVIRSIGNTRPKDFYDVYALDKLEHQNIDFTLLRTALQQTARKRNSLAILRNYQTVLEQIVQDSSMQRQWFEYQKTFEYAKSISFAETCQAVAELITESEI